MKALNFFQVIAKFFGAEYRYYVNHGTKEIHDVKRTEKRCNLDKITNASWVTEKGKDKLVKQGYNGCRYCMPEKDEG